MTRVAGFNLLMPRRVHFTLQTSGVKERLSFNDYLLFYESEEECLKRIRDSLGLAALNGLKSLEKID